MTLLIPWIFLLGTLPLVYTDLKSFWVPFWPLVGVSFCVLVLRLMGDVSYEVEIRLLTGAYTLFVGGVLWFLFSHRFGLGDVFYVTAMALTGAPWEVFFSVVLALILGMVFFVVMFIQKAQVATIRLPMVPLFWLGFLAVQVIRSF